MVKGKKLTILLGTLLGLTAVSLAFLWLAYGQKAQSYECTNYAMDTYIQQTVYGKNRVQAAAAAAKSIGALEDLISWKEDSSDIAKLNKAAGVDWINLDPKVIGILQTGLDVAQKSDGAFEPTLLPIASMWDFGGENQRIPSPEDIKKYLQYVNYKNLRIDKANSTASLKNHYMAVDLSGLEKGAACDEAIAAYRSAGADSGIIAVGSSIGVYGVKSDRSLWQIAIRDPHSSAAGSAALGEVTVSTGFISTSDIYEKSFVKGGVTYHHLLNPKSGYPQNNGLVSVTVVSDRGTLSDALSTACFILGKEKGTDLLKQYHAGGIFIDSKNQVFVTEGLKSSFKLTAGRYSLTS